MKSSDIRPGILITGSGSGSGKTLMTCGLMQAFKNRGVLVSAFKCGPDYIDPMFHRTVLSVPSRNLDSFFLAKDQLKALYQAHTSAAGFAIAEGVMGYYDGIAGTTLQASSYEVACMLGLPAVFVADGKGMSLSLLAVIKGFCSYRADSRIRGILLNRVSPMLYPGLKKAIEKELGIPVFGYLPVLTEGILESRHLGLVMPGEIPDLRKRLDHLAAVMEETIDLDGLLQLGQEHAFSAAALPEPTHKFEQLAAPVRIGWAKDAAFCFYYEENLELLRRLGAELIPFSPIEDQHLPKALDGILLGGGYPELHLEALSQNESLRAEIQKAIKSGLPCIAECGGYLYLHEYLKDQQGRNFPMAGVLAGYGFYGRKKGRFGYINVTAKQSSMLAEAGAQIKGHEFHYWESSREPGAFSAVKPVSGRQWDCMDAEQNLAAGFPHLYYPSNPEFPARFIRRCREYKEGKRNV